MSRIWYQGSVYWNVISTSISGNIVVTLQNASYTYSGSTISTNALVSAYDYNGSRIAQALTLTIDSGPATFTGGVKTTSITTSASVDTSVAISITGSGAFNITAQAVI
jgi:hypothetical protein